MRLTCVAAATRQKHIARKATNTRQKIRASIPVGVVNAKNVPVRMTVLVTPRKSAVVIMPTNGRKVSNAGVWHLRVLPPAGHRQRFLPASSAALV